MDGGWRRAVVLPDDVAVRGLVDHAHELTTFDGEFPLDAYKMFINGEMVDAMGGKTMQVIDPGTGQAFAEVPLGDERDVDAAVRAAREAFESGV